MNNTSIFARISACNARVAAMQADNALRVGIERYGFDDFLKEADKLEELANLAEQKHFNIEELVAPPGKS